MRFLLISLLSLTALPGLTQECDTFPVPFYSVLNKPKHAGDSITIEVTNKGKHTLYYDHREDLCYFSHFIGNLLDRERSCETEGSTLEGILKPDERIRIRARLMKNGTYMFVFSTNRSEYPFRIWNRKKWKCITLSFQLD